MRKLAVAGVFAASVLGVSLQAGAASTAYVIDGTLGANEQSCTQVAFALFATDCTYGRNRPNAASGNWQGPQFGGGHYTADGVKDKPTYIPTSGTNAPTGGTNPADFIPAVDDGKLAAPITGEITIDDNSTPGDPTDDIIGGTFSIGAMARNFGTGQTTRAVERWTTMDHVIAPTAVNPTATVATGAGAADYVVGTRGFPEALCFRHDPADCFTTSNSLNLNATDATFWADKPINSTGIERSGRMGDPNFVATNPAPSTPTGNLGATSTATFTGYSCEHNNLGQDDCVVNQITWGGTVENAGFDNMIMKISTNGAGQITSATVLWTEEYIITLGAPPHLYDNSSQMGLITFTGAIASSDANAQDFAASVLQGSTVNTLDTVTNSVNFAGAVTVTIVTSPAQGTASVNVDQTINYNATGAASGTQTIVYQATDGVDSDQGTITITVAANALPVAPDGSISISTQGAAPGAGTAGNVIVANLPGYVAGNTPSVVAIVAPLAANGTAAVTGTTIRFTPATTFFVGTDTINYSITDADSDTDSGVITVTIDDVNPALSDGTITTDQDRASSALSLGITPGNGSVAQHTLAVSTQAANGTCNLTGTSVTYTPAAGYFGSDSCVVTITDGNGDTDTGALTITVNQVSDDLKLPGGGSAVDPWSLAFLGALPLLRRRRRA